MALADTLVSYNLVLLFPEPLSGYDPDLVQTLPKMVVGAVDDHPGLRLLLNRVKDEPVVTIIGQSMVHGRRLTWTGPPMWRLTLESSRIDLVFNATGHEETTGEEVTLATVVDRVADTFAAVSTRLPIRRVGLITRVLASEKSVGDPRVKVARGSLSTAIAAAAEAGEVEDVVVRLNMPATWELSGFDGPVAVNLIEQVEAQQKHISGDRKRNLSILLDANTSPDMEPGAFSPLALSAFWRQAAQWSADRAKAILAS